MPIYEYECEECHKVTEQWRSISEEPLTTCPVCQGQMKKLISSSSFQLKGGGWYADGYSHKQPAKCDSPSTSSASSTSCEKAATCPCAS